MKTSIKEQIDTPAQRRTSNRTLKSMVKRSAIGPAVGKDGMIAALVRGCSARGVVEFDESATSLAARLDAANTTDEIAARTDVAISKSGARAAVLETPGMTIRWGSRRSGVQCRISELLSRSAKGSRVVATIEGDVDVEFGDIGLIEVGRTAAAGGASVLAPSAGAVFARRVPVRIPLGSATLVVDDEASTVTPASSIDLAGRVFRLGSTGLLMTFDSMSFTATPEGTEIDLRGGTLVGVA